MKNKFDYMKYYTQSPTKSKDKTGCLQSNIVDEEYVPNLVFDLNEDSEQENICIYVDRVFDGKVCISGALTDSLSIVTTTTIVQNTPPYITSSQFINCKDGSNLSIGSGAEFFIENTQSEVIKLTVDTLPISDILLNGMQPSSLQSTTNNKFDMYLNTSLPFIPPKYTLKNIGKNVSAIFNNISTWRYILRHTLHGKIKYNNQIGEFIISIINNVALNGGALFPSTTSTPNRISFAIPELSVPSRESKLQLYFKGDSRLVNPKLFVRMIPNRPTEVVLESNLVVIPKLILEVIEKSRIVIPATLL